MEQAGVRIQKCTRNGEADNEQKSFQTMASELQERYERAVWNRRFLGVIDGGSGKESERNWKLC